MATGEGLYDEAVMAFPGLLVFASMFGSRRLFLGLMALILGTFATLYVLDRTGILRALPEGLTLGRAIILSAILGVTGFFVWLLSGDLRNAMAQLESDKQALIASHDRIEVLAHRDTLTNLPNRALAKDRLEQLLLQAKRNQSLAAVMFLDLDNFKTVNDSLGHAAGDQLLCMVSERLMGCVRESDTVARLGGDEFLLLLGEIHSEEAITTAATKVMQQLGRAFEINGLDVVATASLGIAVYPRDGTDMDLLLKNADLAMYRAKDAGRNAFRFFDAAMNESVVEHLHMASGLRTALGNGELRVHYQPQFDLTSGGVIGAEALLRWKHPALGYIPPNKFIPVAERTGLINEVGAWVLREACRDAQAWRRAGLGDLAVAVNVSPVQFRRDDIEREVANALSECDLPPSALELELTESLLVADAQHVSEVLHRLRTVGIKFAIDDFGTGYSNLGYLQRFAVHRLKIDQSFVRQMGSSAHEEGIVRAIIEMAHCLGLEVVAEGVEDAAMLGKLQAFGCEFGQGFHWSPALPQDQFIAYAQKRLRAA
jgi:diguanylate cyclase (GGDEF)-like protein